MCRHYSSHRHNAQELTAHLDTSSKTVVTQSKPTAFPSALRAKRSEVQTIEEGDVQTSSTIDLPCEKCGRPQVRYYTQQLRGADEGTTVFYECVCGHKYVYPIQNGIEPLLNAILQVERKQLSRTFDQSLLLCFPNFT